VAQADLEVLGIEARVPLADGFVFVVEHADEPLRALLHVARPRVDVRLVDRSGGREIDVAEVRLVARSGRGLGYVKSWHGAG
jgi:hypothetical protein